MISPISWIELKGHNKAVEKVESGGYRDGTLISIKSPDLSRHVDVNTVK